MLRVKVVDLAHQPSGWLPCLLRRVAALREFSTACENSSCNGCGVLWKSSKQM